MRDFNSTFKIIISFCLLIAIAAGSVFGGSYLVLREVRHHPERLPDRCRTIVELQNESPRTLDVLLLGDSLSYCSFSPMQLWNQYGISSYSGTQSAQNIQESYYMLKSALKTQQPKVVVLETNTIFRERKGLSGLSDTLTTMVNYYCPAISYHDIWKTYFSNKRFAHLDYKGFVLRDLIAPYSGGEYMHKTNGLATISSNCEYYLDQIQNLCERNNIDLMLVSAPSPMNYNYEKHNALKSLASQKKLPYIDLNIQVDTMKIDWKHDSLDNGDHLNLRGAEKTTAFLGKKLNSMYDFSDHRHEKNYELWNAQAKEYKKKVKEVLKEMDKKESIAVG